MAQRLIVEGNDGIFLATLCQKKGMKPPKGYSNPQKFRDEFIKNAGGVNKIKLALEEELNSPNVTRIGVVVDSNSLGPLTRFNTLIDIIKETLQVKVPEGKKELTVNGFTHSFDFPNQSLVIGIWVMPDNINEGYLEHFIGELTPSANQVFLFARKTVQEFKQEPFCELSPFKVKKAEVHTYLALQKTPGLPFGTALRAGYFDENAPLAKNFKEWFQSTFELEGG